MRKVVVNTTPLIALNHIEFRTDSVKTSWVIGS